MYFSFREFPCAGDGHPLAQRHREGSRHQAGHPGDQDDVSTDRRPGDAHHEAQVGAQSVIRTQHRGAQRIAPNVAVAAFDPCELAALRAARAPQHRLQNAGVRAFLRGHPRLGRLGLMQVIVPALILARGDSREDKLSTEAPRDPGEEARPPAGPSWPWLDAGRA